MIQKPEVYAFRKGSLIVYFRLYLDRRKLNSIIESETRVDDKSSSATFGSNSKPIDDLFSVKLVQKELREGISQLKITGTEQIIIDIKSIQLINELEATAERNVNEIKTSGFANNKPLPPIKAKDTKQLSNKSSSSESQPKTTNTSDKNRNTSNSTTTTTTSTTVTALPSQTKDDTSVESNYKIETNTGNTVPLISSTLSTQSHSTTISSTAQSVSESVPNNIFTSSKSNNSYTITEYKSSTVPPKSEHRNPFLPFTRRQSTLTPLTSVTTTSSTNYRITTRSRTRSTTTSTTTTTPPPIESSPSSSPSTPSSPPQLSLPRDPTNVLLKRTDIRDDIGLRVSGLDFGQWKPVVPQQVKPVPKPLPPKPIPPPMQSQSPHIPLNQFAHNLKPVPPQVPNYRPHPRIPIGIPMRELPRLLDTEDDNLTNLVTQKDIQRINSSIISAISELSSTTASTTTTISTTSTTTAVPISTTSTTISPPKSLTTRWSRTTLVDNSRSDSCRRLYGSD